MATKNCKINILSCFAVHEGLLKDARSGLFASKHANLGKQRETNGPGDWGGQILARPQDKFCPKLVHTQVYSFSTQKLNFLLVFSVKCPTVRRHAARR